MNKELKEHYLTTSLDDVILEWKHAHGDYDMSKINSEQIENHIFFNKTINKNYV